MAQEFIDNCIVDHGAGELTAIDAAKAKWWSSQVQNEIMKDLTGRDLGL